MNAKLLELFLNRDQQLVLSPNALIHLAQYLAKQDQARHKNSTSRLRNVIIRKVKVNLKICLDRKLQRTSNDILMFSCQHKLFEMFRKEKVFLEKDLRSVKYSLKGLNYAISHTNRNRFGIKLFA